MTSRARLLPNEAIGLPLNADEGLARGTNRVAHAPMQRRSRRHQRSWVLSCWRLENAASCGQQVGSVPSCSRDVRNLLIQTVVMPVRWAETYEARETHDRNFACCLGCSLCPHRVIAFSGVGRWYRPRLSNGCCLKLSGSAPIGADLRHADLWPKP